MSYNSRVKSATELFDDSDDVIQSKSATIPGNKISSATELFDDSDVDEYPSFKAAPKGEYNRIGPLPMPEYTGSKGEEYIAQFMGNVAESMSLGFVDAPPRQGLPGESAVRVGGKVAGAVPSLLAGAGVINWSLKGIISKLPSAAKGIITVSRAFFTEEAVRGAITNSVDFYNAMKAGDTDAMEDAAAMALIDTAFAALMAKGWVEDANKLKTIKAELDYKKSPEGQAAMFEKARRIYAEKGVWPEGYPKPSSGVDLVPQPKTLAEAQARTTAPSTPSPGETLQPSPELVTKVDSQENIAKVSKASKDIKAKARKKPETEIARKEKTVAQIKARTEAELKKTEKQKVDVTVSKPTSATELFSDTEMVKEVSPKTVEAIQKRVTEKLQPRETIMAESTGGGTQDSWLLRTRSGARMEVTFGDETVYVDQVSVPKAMQRKGVASQLYERLGEMMKQRGIPGSAIEGNIQGPPEAITKLRARAASIAGEGKPGEGRYEIDLGEEAEPEVPLKINETVAEGPKLTGAQYDEMEKIYGKDLTELTDQDVSDYLAGKAKPSGEVKLAKRVKEISDEDIEKFYGKPVEEISDEEIDKFFEITPEFEEIRDVDTQIGVEEPPELVSEESSIFRQDPETTKASVDNYKRSQSVAKTINELLVKDPTKPQKDVGPTTWSLITQVNHWLNGGETDIGETRNFLSNLATRADEFRWQFDQPGMNSAESQEAFDNWKELVSDAAVWARRVDRGKLILMRSGGPSTKEIFDYFKNLIDRLKSTRNVVFRSGSIRVKPGDKFHGTDIDKLESILKGGVEAGSALDTTGDWINEYPIVVSIPEAKQGEYVEHNLYYKTASKAKVDKVYIDMSQYQHVYANKIRSQIGNIVSKNPNIKFIILNDPGPYKPKYTVNDLINLTNQSTELLKRGPDPKVKELRKEKDIIRAPYKTEQGYYKNIPRNVDNRIRYIDSEIKSLERSYNRELSILDSKIRDAELDVDTLEGTDFSRENINKMYSGGPSTEEIAKVIRGWYSALKNYAQEKLGNRATGKQIKATLRKGVTQDEWSNVGLDAMLKDDVVYDKMEVLKKIEEGSVEFKDVLLEDKPEVKGTIDEGTLPKSPKFSSYVEPGGTNYKELFVTAPNKILSYEEFASERTYLDESTLKNLYNDYLRGGSQPQELDAWQDGHPDYADIENPVVRLRFDDRTGPYKNLTDAEQEEYTKLRQEYRKAGLPETGNDPRWKRMLELEDKSAPDKILFIEELQGPTKENQDLMPDYLRKRIREIGMKRAIQYAIDNGYDKVAWTTGEMQANRYSLDTYFKDLYYSVGISGDRYSISSNEGSSPLPLSNIKKEYLHNYVGDEIANRIIKGEGEDLSNEFKTERVLRGVDLKIKNEGLRKLYDQDLPNVAKKLGANIENIQINIKSMAPTQENLEKALAEYFDLFAEEDSYTYKLNSKGASEFGLREGMIWGNGNEPYEAARNNALFLIKNNIDKFAPKLSTSSVPSFSIAPLAARKPIHYMYSGGPSTDDLIAAAIKAARAFRDSMIRDVKAEKMAGKEIHRNVKEELVKALVERSGNIARILTSPESYKKYGDFGYRIVRNMYLSKGATPRATNAYRQFAKEVYGGLNRRESEIVDRLAMAVRMVDIGKYKSPKQFKFPEGKDPNSSALYLASFGQIEGLTPERAFELYHTNKDGTIGGRVGAGFEAVRRTITDMRDEAGGLIGSKECDDLIAHKYRRLGTIDNPTTLASIFDKEYRQTVGDIARNVYDSGIEKLAQGHETDIFKPSWKLMTFETLVRAYGRLANNEANHTLLELAKAFPDNPFVRTKIRPTQELSTQPFKRGKLNESIQIKRLEQGVSDYELKELVKTVAKKNISYKRASIDELKAIDNALGPISKGYAEKAETIPRGWVPTYGYDKGHRTTVWMEPSFAKEWIVNSKDITPRAARVLKWLTMAPITRIFATGIDPGFALANLPRDMLHLWFAAREYVNGQWKPVYSPVSTVFTGQLREDLAAVSGDALLRKGWWDDYIKYGGGMDFLVLQGRPFQKGVRIDNSLDEVINYLGYLNESSEVVTRLAITRRALINAAARNEMTLEEARNNPEMMRDAVFAARDYMDFSQGGWLVKFVDQFIPYFNASVLGVRTFARSFKSGKNVSQKSWWKLGQFALLIAGLYVASKKWAPETMKELKGDINSQNNIILPLGDIFGFEDEMGQKRYPYFKIPLDPSVRALKKFFEFTTDEAMGEETDVAGTFNAIKQISPVDVSTLPPLENAIFEYFANYDTYKMRAIRRDEEVFSWPKSREEYSKDTPQALIDIGKVTGASPDRIKVAMSEMISSSSFWAWLLGEAYNKIFGQMPEDLREKHLAESLAKFPLTGRFMGLTNPYTRFAESIEKASEDAAFDRFIQRRNLDILIDGYLYKKSVDREKIELYMRSFNDKQVYDRLDDRFKFAERTADMPHRSLWLRMEALNNEARARIYVEQIFDNPQLLSEFNDVNNRMRHTSRGGLSTEGFRREVSRLQAKSGESE